MLWNLLSDRRRFLTRLALLFGGAVGALVLPSDLIKNNSVMAIGQKQSDLLAACQSVAGRMGVLRTMSIEHYANDGQIEMTWAMILPSENSIDQSTDQLAQQLASLAQSH